MNIYSIMLLVIIVALVYNNRHLRIKVKTFFKKGFRPNRGVFGVYCYCGKQGSGKTYSVVRFLIEQQKKNPGLEIYSNLSSLEGIKYTYFQGFDELLKLRSKSNCIIVYDEIFTALTKTSRMNNEVLDFLSQMRKRKIIFLTTAQEWLEINITLRRYCRYQIDCSMRTFFVGILMKKMYDAENMKWSNEINEYDAPLLTTTIEKCNVEVANSYDTFEQINTIKKDFVSVASNAQRAKSLK